MKDLVFLVDTQRLKHIVNRLRDRKLTLDERIEWLVGDNGIHPPDAASGRRLLHEKLHQAMTAGSLCLRYVDGHGPNITFTEDVEYNGV